MPASSLTKAPDHKQKTAENVFFQSCLFEKQILQLKRVQKADSNDIWIKWIGEIVVEL